MIEIDVTQLVIGILTFLGIGGAATIGGQKVASGRKAIREAAEEAGRVAAEESLVPRGDVAEAVRLERMDGKLDRILERQDEHAKADERRFEAVEAFAKETRVKVHEHSTAITRFAFEIPKLDEDLRQTRRDAMLDSAVTDLRKPRAR